MIRCFKSNRKNIKTRTLWDSLKSCKAHITNHGGEYMDFITRDGLAALVSSSLGSKNILVYVDEK